MSQQLRILHLEDFAPDAEIVRRALDKAGFDYTIRVVDNRESYEEALSDYDPDIVISDHTLYQFNSLDALRIFKEKKLSIPFILVTGTVSEEFAVTVLKSGADDYLLKDNLTRLPHAILSAIREKSAKKEKEAANESLRILFKNIDEVFFTIDPSSGTFVQISDACSHIYGRPMSEFLANSALWLDVIHTEDAAARETLESIQDEPLHAEYRIMHHNSTTKWVATRLVPTLDENRRLVRIDGISTDITTTKEAELALADKMEELKTVIYRLYHDLRGPLTSTAGLINLARTEVKEPPATEYLTMIEEANNRLDKILLGIAQLVDADHPRLERTEITFREMVADIINIYKDSNAGKETEFNTDIRLDKEVYHHEPLLYCLLDNLIGNAVYFRRRDHSLVNVRIGIAEKKLLLEVEDNGIGIEPEYRDRIFEIFFRANESSRGSGLGLYIVKNIVSNLKGEIKVSSTPGNGSCFRILLPLE
jgi:signal transduction histidine kinase